MSGRHRATEALTEPIKAINPPIDPAPETASMPAITAADVAEWDQRRKEMNDPDEWMAPLRTGGARVERQMWQTFRERSLLLAKRVGRRALKLRRALALAKGGRR